VLDLDEIDESNEEDYARKEVEGLDVKKMQNEINFFHLA